mmetsp:Transcript_394/g.1093  ORF Transcript_394/g.1093 Transcript_394/m.1093 type:complete len:125 (+) Transcript_394:80-454(+)
MALTPSPPSEPRVGAPAWCRRSRRHSRQIALPPKRHVHFGEVEVIEIERQIDEPAINFEVIDMENPSSEPGKNAQDFAMENQSDEPAITFVPPTRVMPPDANGLQALVAMRELRANLDSHELGH